MVDMTRLLIATHIGRFTNQMTLVVLYAAPETRFVGHSFSRTGSLQAVFNPMVSAAHEQENERARINETYA